MSDKQPNLVEALFIAENSVNLGEISVGKNSSIWYGCTLRGDLGAISIGRESIIQDLVIIKPSVGKRVVIGDEVVVSSKAYLADCVLESRCFVGLGSTVNEGCRLESYAVLAAGAVLQSHTHLK